MFFMLNHFHLLKNIILVVNRKKIPNNGEKKFKDQFNKIEDNNNCNHKY